MDRLSGDENYGNTRWSRQDIIDFFYFINPNLDKELLNRILDGDIRGTDGGFIRYNARKQNFEYYIPERKNK